MLTGSAREKYKIFPQSGYKDNNTISAPWPKAILNGQALQPAADRIKSQFPITHIAVVFRFFFFRKKAEGKASHIRKHINFPTDHMVVDKVIPARSKYQNILGDLIRDRLQTVICQFFAYP